MNFRNKKTSLRTVNAAQAFLYHKENKKRNSLNKNQKLRKTRKTLIKSEIRISGRGICGASPRSPTLIYE